MPLLDHFHPPLSAERRWESFLSSWATKLADALTERWLPPGYIAEEHAHFGPSVEIDVATFEREASANGPGQGGAVATVGPKARLRPFDDGPWTRETAHPQFFTGKETRCDYPQRRARGPTVRTRALVGQCGVKEAH